MHFPEMTMKLLEQYDARFALALARAIGEGGVELLARRIAGGVEESLSALVDAD